MRPYPSVPHVEDVPALLDGGHLWLQELLDAPRFRFQLRESGVLRFGDGERTFRQGEVPLAYEHAVSHVRRTLERDGLRDAVDDVESVVFFARAMHRRGLDYEWLRTPSVLGVDVWDAERERFLPPDAVEAVFERLGLEPVNTIQKEVRATDFQPDAAAIPDSAWRDGPAAGLLLRNKTGGRAKLPNPDARGQLTPEPITGDPDELAEQYATDRLLRTVAERMESEQLTVEALFDRVMETVLRSMHDRFEHGQSTVAVDEFRSAVAARTQTWLAETQEADA